MKKLLFLIIAVLSVAVLVSCGSDKTDPSETTDVGSNETVAETEGGESETPSEDGPKRLSKEEKAKFYKVVEFDLPEGDFRDVIVDYMRKQSAIEWVCGADFSVSEKWAHWGINLDFKRGETYHGIPYADTKVSYIQFQNALVNGKYTSASSAWEDVYGVQCISSIMNSLQQFDPTVAGTSNHMMPSYDTFEAKICGEYKVTKGLNKTKDIIEENGKDVILNAYTQLRKGDIICTKDDSKGMSHFRVLVEDATVYKNGSGAIVPSRSSIKTIEQTNAFDSTRKDGVKTTWFVDHIYSFQSLYDAGYIPLTLESYSKSRNEMEIPYIGLDDEISAELLKKGSFSSTVKSNFPIRYVQLDVLNKDGVVVASQIKGNMEDSRAVPLRNHFSKLFEGVESGDYTLVCSAGIAIDSCELQRVDFTYVAK